VEERSSSAFHPAITALCHQIVLSFSWENDEIVPSMELPSLVCSLVSLHSFSQFNFYRLFLHLEEFYNTCFIVDCPNGIGQLRSFLERFVPRPRLVGVELNPGPHRKKSSVVKEIVKMSIPSSSQSVAVKHKVPKHSRRTKVKSRIQERGVLASLPNYMKALTDPWFAPPVRLGWGSFTPSSLRAAWIRNTYSPSTTTTAFVVRATPTATSAGTATSGTSGFLQTFESGSSSGQLSSASTSSNFAATNSMAFAAAVQTGRVVSMALRVTVRYPAANARGNLYGVYVPDDSGANLVASSYLTLASLFTSRTAQSSAAGEITIEVQYRPADSSSFAYNSLPTASLPATTSLPQLLVIGTGWAPNSGFTYEVNIIAHYETLSGLDLGGDDVDDGNSLAANGVTMDQAGQASTKAGEAVITSGFLLDALDSATSNISRARSGLGRSSRMIATALSTISNLQNSQPILDPGLSSSSLPGVLPASSGLLSQCAHCNGVLVVHE